ncbi:DUF2997 domain-containing protein [Methanococcoides orientis]|uniref:DUF2997 domain-containing protein n=1 Tax=Methanococcoides orientis TaxID=2822137 RepID=UPI001E45174B|nr:DUF2997 domain-containing protein [Methanococcoides orientis]UGV41775.1 DUF2997 domain-containing protein [Methanococcoides orientis]
MAEQRITIEIDEEGKIVAKTSGFKGEACMDELQKLLDGEVCPSTLKPTDDFHQKKTVNSQQKQSLGGK